MNMDLLNAERILLNLCRDRKNWEACASFNAEAFMDDKSVAVWGCLGRFHAHGDAEAANSSHLRLLGLSLEELEWSTPLHQETDADLIAMHLRAAYAKRQIAGWVKKLQSMEMDETEFSTKYEQIRDDLTPMLTRTYDMADEWIDEECEKFKKLGTKSTGFRIFDCVFRWVPGNLYLLGADTGAGKSLLADALMSHFLESNGGRGILLTLEMNRMQRAARWKKGYTKGEASKFFMPAKTYRTLGPIVRECEAAARAGFSFAVIDHFHLIENDTRMTQTEFENHAARALERLAERTGMVFLVVVQVSKEGAKTGKAAGLNKHSIKGSKGLADAAAGIFMLERGEDADSLRIDKSRFFSTGAELGVVFNWKILKPRITSMEEAAKEKNLESFRT